MLYAILSDIHSNLEAFEAVLQELQKEEIDRFIFLGDIVGYGPNPNECIELTHQYADVSLAGNHDWAALGMLDINYFNPYARQATLWTRDNLTQNNLGYLQKLPLTKQTGNLYLVHASPYQPDNWHYLDNLYEAKINFEYFATQICLLGHSHVPMIFVQEGTKHKQHPDNKIIIGEKKRYIINVGSIGQPRDGNPDAAYALYNTDTNFFEIRRVKYNIRLTQDKMNRAKLPSFLTDRLSLGQ